MLELILVALGGGVVVSAVTKARRRRAATLDVAMAEQGFSVSDALLPGANVTTGATGPTGPRVSAIIASQQAQADAAAALARAAAAQQRALVERLRFRPTERRFASREGWAPATWTQSIVTGDSLVPR